MADLSLWITMMGWAWIVAILILLFHLKTVIPCHTAVPAQQVS